MGRPIKSVYFGNTNSGTTGTADNGIGGEGVASVTIGGTWADFATGTTAVTFSAPQLPRGVRATGTAVINGGGAVTGVTITNKGSGYISAPTVVIVDTDGGAETTGTATAILTTTETNALDFLAWIPGGASAKVGDIIKQVGDSRYQVQTADGVGIVRLVAKAPAAGEMALIATDSLGNTYYVTRLHEHKALVVRKTGTTHEFANLSNAAWTIGAAAAGKSVTIANK